MGVYGIGGCPDCNFERYLFNVTSQNPIIFLTDLLATMEDLAANSTSQVVNIGLGVPDLPQIREYLEEYIDSLSQRANIVASAGMDPTISSGGPGPEWYPAADERVIGVGATGAITGTTINPLAIADYTNDNPDVVAPGTQIYVPTAFTGNGNATYELKDGTGSSTALVSSVLGLLWSEYLETPRNFPRIRNLSQAEKVEYFKNLIENTATDLGAPGPDSVFGHGLVNAQSALETMVNDQAPDVAPGLTKGFQEWRQDQAGGIVWQSAVSRFNTTPRTTGKINESGTFGRCAIASAWDEIKVELSRPRFTYSLENFTATAQILEPENRVKVMMSYRPVVRGYVRGDYYTWLTCFIGIGIGLTINFSYGENAAPAQQEIYFKLENGRYEIQDSRIVEPANRVWAFGVVNSLPNWVSNWIVRQIEDFGEFDILDNVQMLYPGVHADISDMIEKVFNKTLFADQGNQSATEYFFSRLEPVASPKPGLSSPRDFNHQGRISQSKYLERTPEPLYRNNISRMTSQLPVSSPFVYSSPNLGDTSVYVGEHFYNNLLRQMYASGAFHAPYNPLLRDVSFRTIPLGHPDYVNFTINGVNTVHQPIFTPFAQVDPNDNIGEVLYFVNINFNYNFTRNGNPYTYNHPLLIEFHTPVMIASMYKKDDETTGVLGPSKFYSKLVPDEHQLTIHGFVPDPEGVLTEQDVKVLLLNTLGMGFTRALNAPSEFMVGVDANVGSRGGIKYILEQANQLYQESEGRDLFIDLQDMDLFNLNLGYLGPGTSTPGYFQSSTNHYTKYFDPVIFRAAAPDPKASVNTPQRMFMYHPLDSNVVANNVFATFSVPNSFEEVTVSPNRKFRIGFPPSATNRRASMGINIAEQLFVATLLGGGGPASGNYLALQGVHQEYEVSGNARHVNELNFSKECDEAFKVQFDYHGSIPVIEEYYLGPYGERPIWGDKDTRVRQVCEGEPIGSRIPD